MSEYTCPVCRNTEHLLGAKFCMICGAPMDTCSGRVNDAVDRDQVCCGYCGMNRQKKQWFAVTRWDIEDAINAAEEQGVPLTHKQATEWWKKNELQFQDLLIERGNEILANMDFREEQ